MPVYWAPLEEVLPRGDNYTKCLEARHKEKRKARARFARMKSREDNLKDAVKKLFIQSNPF